MRKLFVIATLMLVVAFAAANVGQAFAVGTGGTLSNVASGPCSETFHVGLAKIWVTQYNGGDACEVFVEAGPNFPYMPVTVALNNDAQVKVCFPGPGTISLNGNPIFATYDAGFKADGVGTDKGMTCATWYGGGAFSFK